METWAADPQSLLKQGIDAYRVGNDVEAEQLCRTVLAADPDQLSALRLLAAVAVRGGRLAESVRLVEHALDLAPDDVPIMIQLANLRRQEGRTKDAVALFDRAIHLEPGSAEASNDLGLLHLQSARYERAADCFAGATRLDPSYAYAWFNRALALEAMGLHGEAVVSFGEAARLRPDLAEAHVRLGCLLAADGRTEEASACYAAASSCAKPGTAFAHLCEARLAEFAGRADDAETSLRRVIALEPRNADAHRMIGSVLMQRGLFKDAAASFDLAVTLNRNDVSAHACLVETRRMTEFDRPLLRRLADQATTPGRPIAEAALLHFALGKAYDDLGEYEIAISHVDQANALKGRTRPVFDDAAHEASIDQMVAAFDQSFFSRQTRSGAEWDGPILIVGMPRSGTTLIEQILSRHPEVAAGGELSFWRDHARSFRADRAGVADPDWVRTTATAYRDLLSDIDPGARRVTDKMPQNTHFLGLVSLVFPNARVIHCRREPVDTCLSIWFANFGTRMDFAYDRKAIIQYYRRYQRLMAHWRATLPRSQLLEIDYEDLVLHQEAVMRRMIDFCGLAWDDACLTSERNPRPIRTASVWQARQPVYQRSVERWRNYERWLGPFETLAPNRTAV